MERAPSPGPSPFAPRRLECAPAAPGARRGDALTPKDKDPTDPFAHDDPVARAASDPDAFDTLGFDTGFGMTPGAPAASRQDDDPTPPTGMYVGEEVQVLDPSAIGRALAEAEGEPDDDLAMPDLAALQKGLVGIDLGASGAVVSRFDKKGRHEIVQNEHDERLTPVAIFFDDDGELIIGREARQMAPSAPGQSILNLKDMISRPGFKLAPGGPHGELDAPRILSLFLARLLEYAAVGASPPTHLALAAPAWFGPTERQVLARAVEMLDVTLVGTTDECLAGAVPYSLRLPDLNPRTALVFDLGHAALGVGLVRCASGDITVLAQGARRDLGGQAWDQLLADEAARKLRQVHGVDPLLDEGSRIDLLLRAEEAKKALSQRAQAALVVSAGGKSLKVGFTRPAFEEAARGLVQRSIEFAREVRQKGGVQRWEDIDAVILTGGGCKTPIVRQALAKETGHEAERGTGMEEGVALGALYWGIGERYRASKKR